jgi:hypothetical protein
MTLHPELFLSQCSSGSDMRAENHRLSMIKVVDG